MFFNDFFSGLGLIGIEQMNKGVGDIGGRMGHVEEPIDECVVPFVFAFFKGFLKRFKEEIGAFLFDFIGGWDFFPFDPALGEADDVLKFVNFAARDESDGTSAASGASSASDAMDIIFTVMREIVVKDNLNIVNIETARCNVGGDEEFETVFTEFCHYPFTGLL